MNPQDILKQLLHDLFRRPESISLVYDTLEQSRLIERLSIETNIHLQEPSDNIEWSTSTLFKRLRVKCLVEINRLFSTKDEPFTETDRVSFLLREFCLLFKMNSELKNSEKEFDVSPEEIKRRIAQLVVFWQAVTYLYVWGTPPHKDWQSIRMVLGYPNIEFIQDVWSDLKPEQIANMIHIFCKKDSDKKIQDKKMQDKKMQEYVKRLIRWRALDKLRLVENKIKQEDVENLDSECQDYENVVVEKVKEKFKEYTTQGGVLHHPLTKCFQQAFSNHKNYRFRETDARKRADQKTRVISSAITKLLHCEQDEFLVNQHLRNIAEVYHKNNFDAIDRRKRVQVLFRFFGENDFFVRVQYLHDFFQEKIQLFLKLYGEVVDSNDFIEAFTESITRLPKVAEKLKEIRHQVYGEYSQLNTKDYLTSFLNHSLHEFLAP